jgi:cytoskeletal protein RodZ
MKSIGQILKEARVEKSYSLAHVEGMTKIKLSFLSAIENESWEALPAFPTVLGFVKSLASALEIDPRMAVAVLKRDYPPKKLRITPKPDVSRKFVWSPKLTFTLGISGVLIILFGYLIFQYIHFVSPPTLSVDSPKENQMVSSGSVIVFGTTDSDAKIVIDNQPVAVSPDGKFSETMDVTPDTHEIDITASSRSGKISEVRRKIIVQ